MCGIGITIERVTVENASLSVVSDDSDDDSTSTSHYQGSELLRRRGPHFQSCLSREIRAQKRHDNCSIRMQVQATVLHVRGTSMEKQPVRLSLGNNYNNNDNDNNNNNDKSDNEECLFGWNGEAYQILERRRRNANDANVNATSHSCSNNTNNNNKQEYVIEAQEVSYQEKSDTQIIANLLKQALMVNDKSNSTSESNTSNERSENTKQAKDDSSWVWDQQQQDHSISSASAVVVAAAATNIQYETALELFVGDSQDQGKESSELPNANTNEITNTGTNNQHSQPQINDENVTLVPPATITATTLTSVAAVCARIWNGDYAFMLVANNALYFGRDAWGRRSLLMSSSLSSWKLTSVAHSNPNPSDTDPTTTATTASTETTCTDGTTWTEVPPGRVYELNFSTGIIRSVAIPTLQPSLPSVPPSLVSSLLPLPPPPSDVSESMWIASYQLQHLLTLAVQRRMAVTAMPTTTTKPFSGSYEDDAPIGLLFSGGLDSVVLAALALQVLQQQLQLQQQQQQQTNTPPVMAATITVTATLDLFNVAFGDNDEAISKSADRRAALASFQELQQFLQRESFTTNHAHSQVNVRLICVNVDWQEVQEYEAHVQTLLLPKTTTMDLNIGTALWFASRGIGTVYSCNNDTDTETANGETNSNSNNTDDDDNSNNYRSKCRVLLLGMGADEQMAGYGRHRTSYQKSKARSVDNGDNGNSNNNSNRTSSSSSSGYDGLQLELTKDLERLWERNLGRDDRMISDCGREARFPYLDKQVTQFLAGLELH